MIAFRGLARAVNRIRWDGVVREMTQSQSLMPAGFGVWLLVEEFGASIDGLTFLGASGVKPAGRIRRGFCGLFNNHHPILIN